MYSLDRKSESGSNTLQCFTFPITLTDEVITFFFGDVFFRDRHSGKGNTPVEEVKQPTYGGVQRG